MGRVKPRQSECDREASIKQARDDYIHGREPSIRSAALTYGVPYGTLRGRLQGAQTRQEARIEQQVLTPQDEKAIVRFCKALDDLGHPLKLKMVKGFAMSLLHPKQRRELGKHWLTRFLNRHPELAAKFSQRLDRQRANANDPAILKDYFRKVFGMVSVSSLLLIVPLPVREAHAEASG